MPPLMFLTDFADLGVILPLSLVVCLALAAVGWRRESRAWAIAVSGTLAVMLMLKLAAFATLPAGVLNPSGHTAAGTVVYGGLLALAASHPVNRLGFALAAGAVMACLIGFTRLEVGEHSLPDVFVGAAVGIVGALALARLSGSPSLRQAPARLGVVVAAALVVVLTFHGQRIPAEAKLRSFVAQFQADADL